MSALAESLAGLYMSEDPAGAARVLEGARVADIAAAASTVSVPVSVAVLRRLNSDLAAKTLLELKPERATETMIGADPVRVARWLALLGDAESRHLLGLLPEKYRKEVTEALAYPAGSAGYYMDPATVPFRKDTQIESVFATIRGRATRVTDVMVCDADDRFIGVVSLHELVGAEPGTTLGSVVHEEVPSVHAMTGRDEVVELLNLHRLSTLPVLDLDGRLLGVIRHDALVRAAQQEAGADLGKMVGAGSEERALSTASSTIKSRLPWLLINLLTAFAAASVVGLFDATIARFTALAVLLPVVAGQSGNTGAQALAVTSRGLALREIRAGHWFPVLRKEVTAALINGLAVSAATCAGVWVWSGSLGLCAVIGISMVVSMVMAAIAGALIPIALTVLGRDPATASSIILTTVTDIAGFFSFLGLATAMAQFLE